MACSGLRDDLIPGQAHGALGFEIVEAPIELGPLGLAQREGVRISSERFPELIEEAELLVAAESTEVQRRVTHGSKFGTIGPERLPRRCAGRDRGRAIRYHRGMLLLQAAWVSSAVVVGSAQ